MGKTTQLNSQLIQVGIFGATIALVGMLAACAPAPAATSASAESGDAPASSQAAADQAETQVAAMEFAWSPEADCTMCHSAEADSLTDATCQISASHGDLQCVQCHADTDGLTAAHEKVEASDTKGAKRLKKTEVSSDACLACHQSDYTPEAVPEVSWLTDDQGTTVNPHDLPESESHSTVLCANCHSMHADDPVATTAAKACTNCHHQNVYQCFTCHE